MARPSAQQLADGEPQRSDLGRRADDAAQLHRRDQVVVDHRQPAAGRGGDVHTAGQLHPGLRTRRGGGRGRHVRPDPLGHQRGLAAHGHQQRANVHLCGKRLVRHRIAQPESRYAGSHRLVAGAVHHARRHPADHEQRRGEFCAAREHPERPQRRRREYGPVRAGFLAARPMDAEPGPPLREIRHVDSGAECAGRHVDARARLRRAERHRELEHGVAAAGLLVGRVR